MSRSAPLWSIPLAGILGVALGVVGCFVGDREPNADPKGIAAGGETLIVTVGHTPDLVRQVTETREQDNDALRVGCLFRDAARFRLAKHRVLAALAAEVNAAQDAP